MTLFLVKLFIAFFACISLCFSQSTSLATWGADYKGENSGHTTANFLTLPVSAGMLSLGNVSSTGMMDATDIPVYPANTALFTYQKIAGTHCEWLLDTRTEYLGACFPMIDIGTVGFYARVFTPGTFSNARTIDLEPSHPSMVDLASGISFARHFLDRTVALGGAVSYIESRIDNESGRTAAFTLDASLTPSAFVNLHLGIANMSPGLTYNTTKEALPAQLGISSTFHPLVLSENITDIFNVDVSAGVNKIADFPLHTGAGLQVSLFRQFFVRTGYDYTIDTKPSIVGLSVGAGIEKGALGADFGWQYKSEDLGPIWCISLKMNIKEITPKTAEEYYAIAEKDFSKHQYLLAIYNAKKAIKLSPGMWKAHALIQMINADERRKQNLEISLIYTGNTKGQFFPIGLPSGSIGGLARQGTIIRQLAEQYPTHIIVDGGNMITETSPPLKISLAQSFYNDLAYDAVSVGDLEMKNGLSNSFPLINKYKTDYIFTNIVSRFGLGNVIAKKVVEKNGYKFFIASVMAQGVVKSEDSTKIFEPLDEVRRIMATSDAKRATTRILIVHDFWQRIPLYAAQLSAGDIILAANLKQEFSTPMKVGPALVLSTGECSKFVGNFTMRFSPEKKLLATENKLIPLTEDIIPDSSIASSIKHLTPQVELDSQKVYEPLSKKSIAEGVFAFCSKRYDVPAILLKVLNKNAEFPLTKGTNECRRPVVSFPASKIAYQEVPQDSQCPTLNIMDLTGTNKHKVPFARCTQYYTFTPDGAWLYFSAKIDGKTSDIFRIKPEGTLPYPIISWKNSEEGGITFSKDSKYMVFNSNMNGKWQLYLTDIEGQKPVCLTDGTADNIKPQINDNGTTIAFLSNRTSFGGSYDLCVYNISTSKTEQITHVGLVKSYCWLNNNTIITSSGGTSSVLKSLDIQAQASTELIVNVMGKNYNEMSPKLIRFGKTTKIMYTREYEDSVRKIYWINPDGTEDEPLVNSGLGDWIE